MITIVFAPPRTGKTCFLTNLACDYAFDKKRTRLMQREIMQKIDSGFEGISTIPPHCVSSNYDMIFKRFRYSPRFNRRINPYRLGYKNDFVETHFNIPYEAIFITEAQKYLNSRRSTMYPSWQSRWYEQHGHNHLDIFLDTQRPMLIDVNIRDLSQFIEIVRMDILDYDIRGSASVFRWVIRRIANSRLFDKYMNSGETDIRCYEEEEVISENKVFDMYDSFSCKPRFYDGHLYDDFDYSVSEPTKEDFAGYVRWLHDYDDELPGNFYVKGVKGA